MHLADAFIQSDLQLHSGYTFSLVSVFPGNILDVLYVYYVNKIINKNFSSYKVIVS